MTIHTTVSMTLDTPLYGAQADVHWTSLYTQRLNKDVKLVGSTINCQPVYFHSDPANEMRQNPHVQSYIAVTDQVRASLLPSDTCSSPHHIIITQPSGV